MRSPHHGFRLLVIAPHCERHPPKRGMVSAYGGSRNCLGKLLPGNRHFRNRQGGAGAAVPAEVPACRAKYTIFNMTITWKRLTAANRKRFRYRLNKITFSAGMQVVFCRDACPATAAKARAALPFDWVMSSFAGGIAPHPVSSDYAGRCLGRARRSRA